MDNDKTNLRANACVPMVEKMQGRYMLRKPLFAFTMWLFDTFCGLILPPSHPEIPETPRRILICNGAHLGDVVMTLPAFKAVRDAFPRSEIGLLIGSWSVPIVQNTGLYNNLHILDSVRHNRGKNAVMRIAQFVRQSVAVIKEIKAKNYDVAIDIYPHFPNSIFTIYAARIPIRCGFTSGGGGAFLTHQVRWQYEGKPMGRCGRNLFTALWPNSAIAQNPLEPCYPGQPRAPLPPTLFTKKYIAIHTGTGAAHKEWPEAHWTRLIDDLLQSGFHIAMLGAGTREAERARRIAPALTTSSSQGGLFLDVSWDSFMTIVAHAACLVCLDSMCGHIAASFNINTVSIYRGTNLTFEGVPDNNILWSPDNPRAVVLAGSTASPSSVTPDMVFIAVRKIIMESP